MLEFELTQSKRLTSRSMALASLAQKPSAGLELWVACCESLAEVVEFVVCFLGDRLEFVEWWWSCW